MQSKHGFTLIEIMVVMFLFVAIASLALFMSLDNYRGHNFRNERKTLVSILQKARSQALANINQKPHGVYINYSANPKTYTIFEGSGWTDPSHNPAFDNTFKFSDGVTPSGFSEVVFQPLSGNTGGDYTLSIQDNNRTAFSDTILINKEGRIDAQ